MTTLHETFAAALADPRALSPVADARGFAVHRNNRAYGLVEAMRAQFPAVARLMGRDVFADAALAFIRQHPPRSPVMARIGATFADFIESAGIAQAYRFLPDVARLEYAMAIAQHAADDSVVRIEALQRIDANRLADVCFSLHASAFVVQSAFPVVTICAENRADAEPAGNIEWRPEDALVTRPGFDVQVGILPPGGAAFVRALSHGLSLGDAAAAALEAQPEFDLALNLSGIFTAGAVTSLRFS
jgi:hypothetical protein